MNKTKDLFRRQFEQWYKDRDNFLMVLGFIPAGGIDPESWTATVLFPNPRQGFEPSVGGVEEHAGYLTKEKVPLPLMGPGLVVAKEKLTLDSPCSVLIAFKGGSLSHPAVIAFLDPLFVLRSRQEEKVTNRQPSVLNKVITPKPPALLPMPLPPRVHATITPAPPEPTTGSPGIFSTPQANREPLQKKLRDAGDALRKGSELIFGRLLQELKLVPKRTK